MVVPEMSRSVRKTAPVAQIAAAPHPGSSPVEKHHAGSLTARPAWLRSPRFAAPKYSFSNFDPAPESVSLGVKLILSAAVAALLVPGWRDTGSPGSQAVRAEATMGETTWIREPVFVPARSSKARKLVLYRPSLDAANYRLEFTWRVNPQGMGWVYRVQDRDNYYAVRIKPLRAGPSGALSVRRFTVYRGVERLRAEKVLPFSSNAGSLNIRMDAGGPTFKLYLQGKAVEYWTDTGLTAGAVGFLEEPDQPAEVQSVRISLLSPQPPIQRTRSVAEAWQ